MKKILSIALLFCMVFTCIPTTVNAAAHSNNETKQLEMLEPTTDDGIVPYNQDVWTTSGLLYVSERGIDITVKPGVGENLKVHFVLSKLFLNNMSLKIYLGNTLVVVEHDTDTMLACDYLVDNWNTEGHHWADVVTNTSSSTYKIRLVGPAYINGAFYTEP